MFEIERVARIRPFTMLSNHFHEAYEIFYLAKGQRDYFIRDRTYRVKEGGIVLIDSYDLHRTIDTGVAEHERYLVNFSPRYLEGIPDFMTVMPFKMGPKCFQLTDEERKVVESLLNVMIAEYQSTGLGKAIYLQSLLIQLLTLLCRALQREQSVLHIGTHATADTQRSTVHMIASFIRANYSRPLSLGYVSKLYYLTPTYLSKIFKRDTGFSFIEYIQQVRVVEAQRLLRETNTKIGDIATLTGFQNIAHFGRVFKQIAGRNPRDYRRNWHTYHLDGSRSNLN